MYSTLLTRKTHRNAKVLLYWDRQVGHVMRKPVFGVSDKVRLKPACAATEARSKLEISDIETRGIILSRQRTTKVLIRLRERAGWSAPLLFAHGINMLSHYLAQVLANTAYPDHIAPSGAVWPGSVIFAIPSVSFACITVSKKYPVQIYDNYRIISGVPIFYSNICL